MPAVPCSTTNAEIPWRAAPRSVTAIATITCPTRPCVVKVLRPFSTQQPFCRTARVCVPAASLPAVRLGQAPCADALASRQRHDEAALLLFGAEHEEVRGAKAVVRRDGQRDRGIDARQFLDADAVLHRGHARAAVGLGDLDAHQPEFGQPRQQFQREVLRLVPFHDVRADLRLGELPDRPPKQFVLVARSKVHGGPHRTVTGGCAVEPPRGASPAAQFVWGALLRNSQP